MAPGFIRAILPLYKGKKYLEKHNILRATDGRCTASGTIRSERTKRPKGIEKRVSSAHLSDKVGLVLDHDSRHERIWELEGSKLFVVFDRFSRTSVFFWNEISRHKITEYVGRCSWKVKMMSMRKQSEWGVDQWTGSRRAEWFDVNHVIIWVGLW